MTDGANGDASLLMLLLEASHEIEPKADPEPFTPVESTLPPSVAGFQAPTPGTRNHTQELLAGRGTSATAGLPPPRAAWSSPLVNDRPSAFLPRTFLLATTLQSLGMLRSVSTRVRR